ncbi:hypothetical protein [Rhodococcus erythropolis]|uniref:hypothetical protein n=1 Tax=Rhodococcus erythropolis TaxID=1833 RepID=UPI003013E66F
MKPDQPTDEQTSQEVIATSGRQLAIVKRTDLSFYEGWAGCFVDWLPANYSQANKMIRADYASMTEPEAERTLLDAIKERMVGGKVKIIEDGESTLVDIEKSDVDVLPSIMVDRLYADMAGLKYDTNPLGEIEPVTESSKDIDSTKPQEPTKSIATQ